VCLLPLGDDNGNRLQLESPLWKKAQKPDAGERQVSKKSSLPVKNPKGWPEIRSAPVWQII
jgi:hypothetical protein